MTFKGTLYDFQKEAYKRALRRQQILIAYSMGLGKTPITIAVVERLIDTGRAAGGLIIAPAGLKYQWAAQIEKFTDGALVQVIDGTPAERELQYRRIVRGDVEYAICNPEQVVNDWRLIQHLKFDFLVLDEATVIKGFKAKRTKRIKRLDAPYKIALTGQPIENRVEELFSILQWVDPDVLGRPDIFEKTFIIRNRWGKVLRYRNLPLLRNLINDVMIRKSRHDPDVASQLPRVLEETVPVKFDAAGAKVYRVITMELIDAIQEAMGQGGGGFDLWRHYAGNDNNKAQGDIASKVTAMRMLCDHPELLRISAGNFDDPQSAAGAAYAAELRDRGLLNDLKSTPKFNMVLDLLLEILEADPANKVVLFSYFKPTLGFFEAELYRRKIGSVQFTGDMNAKEKGAALARFKSAAACRVFLSSDAGSYGVDLPEANYCVKDTTLVLRGDLRWDLARNLKAGDSIVGVEENRRGGKGFSRRWEMGTVTSNLLKSKQTLKVGFSNGESLTVTPEHKMLVQTGHGNWQWREAQDLQPGWRVSKALQPWLRLSSYEAGWLAGILDGEGCLSRMGHGLALSVAQNPGPVLEKVSRLAGELGFELRDDGRETRVRNLVLRGGKAEMTRFLGMLGPQRLVDKWGELIGEHVVQAVETPEIVSIKPAGLQTVSILNTTTRTFLAEGYVQHNCINYNLPWSAGAWAQRNARIVRLSSEWEAVTLVTPLMKGSIEERMYAMLEQKKAVASAILDGEGIDAKGGFRLTLGTLLDFVSTAKV